MNSKLLFFVAILSISGLLACNSSVKVKESSSRAAPVDNEPLLAEFVISAIPIQYTNTMSLAWTSSHENAKYNVSIATDKECSQVVLSQKDLASLSSSVVIENIGIYFACVTAILDSQAKNWFK